MNRTAGGILYALVMVAVIVAVDLTFFRDLPGIALRPTSASC